MKQRGREQESRKCRTLIKKISSSIFMLKGNDDFNITIH